MGKAVRASALILLLACSAQAGWMPNDSPQPKTTQEPTTHGVIHNPPLVQIALSVLALI